MKKNPLILGIDTSCDETSVAILMGRRVIANVVSSQTELHKKWGGVVPRIAKRAHEENLPLAANEALKRAGISFQDLDLVAVTYGPGLAIDLEVGVQFAKDLYEQYRIPTVAVNHMEGHLYSSLLLNSKGGDGPDDKTLNKELFPALGLLVSGKHTEIILVESIGNHRKIGWTLDDAAGEAFDKVGRMLNFGYPGGPIVSQFAKRGSRTELFNLPLPLSKSKDLNFSYSGLKTSCLYQIEALRREGVKDREWVEDFCFMFVDAVITTLQIKLEKAIKQNQEVKSVLAGGGVYHNESLSKRLSALTRKLGRKFLLPVKKYRSDNAAMIALVGYFKYQRGEILTTKSKVFLIDRVPRLTL